MRIFKRTVTVGLCLLVSFLLFSIVTVQIPAGPPAPVATENGDTNGDGILDVADAVHLLFFLFRDGDPPVAVAATSPIVEEKVTSMDAKLGDIAGQVASMNAKLDALTDMNGKMDVLAEALSEIASNSAAALETPCEDRPNRFIDNGDGTVTDACTGLMWKKRLLDSGTWVEAVAVTEGLEFSGHTDWRLPSIEELSTIFREGWGSPSSYPIIGIVGGTYWSSTIDSDSDRRSWVLNFGTDSVTERRKVLANNDPARRAAIIAVRDS